MKTTEQDYSISFVRFFAMVFIVACHMMQRDHVVSIVNGYTIEWAYWFNVGVQMFLFISGYLYGRKEKVETADHYKRGFTKILIEYYLFVAIVSLVNYIFPRLNIDQTMYWNFFILKSNVPGLGHLWFVPTILFCYLLIPVFLPVIDAFNRNSDSTFLIRCLLLAVVVHIVIRNFFQSFSAAYVNCFLFGIVYSYLERRGQRSKTIVQFVFIVLCIGILLLRIKNEYMPHEELTGFLGRNYSIIKQYGHVFLGITLFIILRLAYTKVFIKHEKHSILDWSDRYSYDVYLTHHIFVQSAFGVVEFITNRWIALPLAIGFTCLASMGLHWISFGLKNLLSGRVSDGSIVSKIQNRGGGI